MTVSINLRCDYTGRLCLHQGCENCDEKLEAMMHVQERFCPLCGADLDSWRETFSEEHRCEG